MGSIQNKVRDGIAKVASQVNPHAILALGDNVYEKGVSSEGQMVRKWRDIWLSKPSLKREWYGVTGNHDWKSDAWVYAAVHWDFWLQTNSVSWIRR